MKFENIKCAKYDINMYVCRYQLAYCSRLKSCNTISKSWRVAWFSLKLAPNGYGAGYFGCQGTIAQ